MLVHYIFVNSLYHVGKHVSKNGHVKKLEGDFSVEKSKIWGATTTPHIVPSAKLAFFHNLFKRKRIKSSRIEFVF